MGCQSRRGRCLRGSGTGSYGAILTPRLGSYVRTVIEVNGPDRSTRRRLGKSDSLDAEVASRAVLDGVAKDYSKVSSGHVAGQSRVQIRSLRISERRLDKDHRRL